MPRNEHDEDLRLRCPGCAKRFKTRDAVANHITATLHGELLVDHSMPDDADLYGRFTISPEAKARADAEWEASDWRGQLPEGWTWEGGKCARPTG